MPSSNTSPSAGSTVVDKLKTYEGGTGQTTAAAALAALGAVPLASVDQPNGVAGLDANKKLSAAVLPLDNLSTVSVQGPSTVIKASVTAYTLTNYDAFSTYALSAISGSVVRNGDTILYTAPSTAQAGGFIVNGRRIDVDVTNTLPVTPVLAGVAMNGVGETAQIVYSTGAYSNTDGSTHLNSDWQVATDAAFTNIVASSMADATNKIAWTSPSVNLSTTYYGRCRHRSSLGTASSWSNTVQLTTAASYTLSTEEAKLAASDRLASDLAGYSVAITSDGSRVIMGTPQSDPGAVTNAGAVYVFLRTGVTWSQEAKLVASDAAASNFLGRAVAVADDGTRVIASAPGNNSGASNKGAAYVFVRDTNTNVWTQEQKLSAADGAASDLFGDLRAVAMDSTGTRAVIGVQMSDPSSTANAGAAYVFSRSGSVWTQEQKLVAGALQAGANFGSGLDISSDGSVIVIGAKTATVNEAGYGEQLYVTPGTYTFTVPAGVTSISMVCVGGGAASTTTTGGGGGALSYKNSFPVTPGEQFTVVVGQGGQTQGANGGNSSITKVGGGLTITCPGGSGSGSASSNATGGDFNSPGGQGSYTVKNTINATSGYVYMGGDGLPSYTPGITPGQAAGPASGGAAGPGSFTEGAVTYTVYQNYNSNTYVYLNGSNGNGTAYGGGGSVSFSGGGTTESYSWNSGRPGGVRFVWGSGKTYPTNAKATTSQGAAYIFRRSGTVWSQEAVISAATLIDNSQFGFSVAVSGNGTRVAVGATNITSGSGVGTATIFAYNAGSWSLEQTLTGSARTASDLMGSAVALNFDGSVVAIGEAQATITSISQCGAFYIYNRVNATWTQEGKISASDKVASGNLGYAVALTNDGLRAVAGAQGSQFSGSAMGAAYVYR
jgi:hypothetical protein